MPRFSLLSLPATIILIGLASAASAQTVPAPPSQAAPGTTASAPTKFRDRFAAANTTHDGCLTLAQAQTANLRPVMRNFAAIDTAHRGCVTMKDIAAYRRTRRASRPQQVQQPTPAEPTP